MKVKFKKLHPDAEIPIYAKNGDAGLDIFSIDDGEDFGDCLVYSTGLAIEIPVGYVGLIFPRSSIARYNLALTNSVGVIDSGYRGEIKFKFRKQATKFCKNHYYKYDRIGQLLILPYPQVELEEVQELSESERGTDGFGSTGK